MSMPIPPIGPIPLYVCYRDQCKNELLTDYQLTMKMKIPTMHDEEFHVTVVAPMKSEQAKQHGGVQCKFLLPNRSEVRILHLSPEQIKQMTLSVEIWSNSAKIIASSFAPPILKSDIDQSKSYCLKITSNNTGCGAKVLEVPESKLVHASTSSVSRSKDFEAESDAFLNILTLNAVACPIYSSFHILNALCENLCEHLSIEKKPEITRKLKQTGLNKSCVEAFIASLTSKQRDSIKTKMVDLLAAKLEEIHSDELAKSINTFLSDSQTQAAMFQVLYEQVGEKRLKEFFYTRLHTILQDEIKITEEVTKDLQTYAEYHLKVAKKLSQYTWDVDTILEKEISFFSHFLESCKSQTG